VPGKGQPLGGSLYAAGLWLHRRAQPRWLNLLDHDDRVRRVSIVGNSGSGKTHLAGRVAAILDVPYIELDAIHHLPGWEPIAPDAFAAEMDAITSTDGWVIDGNYRTVVVDGPVWQRAHTVVWLDLSRLTVMRRVATRTLRRMIRREELWNGNREPIRNLYARDPSKSIIRWAWTQHAKYQHRFSSAMSSPELSHITFVRLRTRAEAERWLGDLRRMAQAPREPL
jgi:adenylate kinase family enzyme